MSGRPFRHLLLGVCGSSAATAADQLLHDAQQHAGTVTVVATPSAARFLPRLTVPVRTDAEWTASLGDPLHVRLLDGVDLFLIAPATATTMAACAHGLASTLLTALVLTHGPGVYFAPSMNRRMWENPATVRAVTALRADGHHILEPAPTTSLADGLPATAVGPVPGTILTTVARLAQHRTGPGKGLRVSP